MRLVFYKQTSTTGSTRRFSSWWCLRILYICSIYLFWTKKKYTWTEAEEFCIGRWMQIASISSEDEFMIVTDMLYGKSYLSVADMSAEHWILTPCRLNITICIAFIGLKLEVRINQSIKFPKRQYPGIQRHVQFLKQRKSSITVILSCECENKSRCHTFGVKWTACLIETGNHNVTYVICMTSGRTPLPGVDRWQTSWVCQVVQHFALAECAVSSVECF